jgi:hypothetical protein
VKHFFFTLFFFVTLSSIDTRALTCEDFFFVCLLFDEVDGFC